MNFSRIVLLSNDSWSLIPFRGELLEEMVARGHEVFACAPDADDTIRKELNDMGVQYRKVKLNRVGLNPFSEIGTLINLSNVFREIKPHVLISYTIKPVLYGSLAAQFVGIQKIFSLITGLGYAFAEEGPRNRVVRYVAHNMYRIALGFNNKVFFQNPDDLSMFTEKRLIKKIKQGVVINGSGVNIDRFQIVDYPESVSFLLIARLLRPKGISEYIEAAKSLKKKYPELVFRIVGRPVNSPVAYTEEDIHEWEEQEIVEYLGELSDVRPAIAGASVFVLPTYYREGTPRTLLEAMAMGRPLITTDTAGCRETVRQGKNGFLIPTKDSNALMEAMEFFVKQPDSIRQMGRVSRKMVVDKYDVEKVNAVLLEEMNLENAE